MNVVYMLDMISIFVYGSELSAIGDAPPSVDMNIWMSTLSLNIYFHIPTSVHTPLNERTIPTAVPQDDGSNESFLSFQAAMLRQTPYSRNGVADQRVFLDADSTLTKTVGIHRRGNMKNSNVVSAKLKLYKIGRKAKTLNFYAAQSCNETTSDAASAKRTSSNFQSVEEVEEKISVSVYWYTMPASRNLIKKKLLETKMLPIKETGWVEFDIHRAATIWLETRANYGLVIQVENEDNDLLDASKFFVGLPCPSEATVDMLPPPVLEICTLSLPVSAIFPVIQNPGEPQRPHYNRKSHRHRHSHGDTQNTNNHRPKGSSTHHSMFQQRSQVDVEILPNSFNNTEISKQTETTDVFSTPSSGRKFLLDVDHPLRDILATVASSSESHQKNLNQQSTGDTLQDTDYSEDYDDIDRQKVADVIVQNIYISPPDPRQHSLHHILSSSSISETLNGQSNPPGIIR
ncbi:unnamed protein product [Allacma fusca]|uniref:TGF-beta propeptide domain-containing protein n=1 Tax=Allacma fusca TaxID=39272 RepID=A0A8J2PTG9_9HEXA|nr:unnamed protein product [Allacma fusca]